MNVFVKTSFLILFFVQLLFAQINDAVTLNNLAVFKELVNKSLNKFIESIDHKNSIILKVQAPDDFKWIFEEQISRFVNEKSIAAVYNFPKTDSMQSALLLDIKLQKSKIEYKSYSFLPKDKILRSIYLDYYINLTQSNNKVILSEQYTNTFQDTIKTDQINQLQDINYPFTVGKKQSKIKNIFEPLLIMSVTGTIVYIFYAFRSK